MLRPCRSAAKRCQPVDVYYAAARSNRLAEGNVTFIIQLTGILFVLD